MQLSKLPWTAWLSHISCEKHRQYQHEADMGHTPALHMPPQSALQLLMISDPLQAMLRAVGAVLNPVSVQDVRESRWKRSQSPSCNIFQCS